MTRICLLTIYLCLVLIPLLAEGTNQPRPFSGSGVVIIRPLNPEIQNAPVPIPFYRDPGVARIVECHVGKIPNLSSILNVPAGEYPLAAMGKKGNWLRIAYDDAGREGWVEMSRWWEYTTWEVYLKGRLVRLLPGLNKSKYALHAGPAETAALTGTLSGHENLRLIEVEGDWALVITNSGLNGWLPWRDGDGRFMVSIGEKINPQKH